MRLLSVVKAALFGGQLAGLGAAEPIPKAAGDNAVAARATTFNNPVLWEDYPDCDVFRVGEVYYLSSSTFAYSPGAPLLKSYDLVNWAPVTHSVPTLNFGNKYNLNSATDRAYVKGIWASSVRYRKSTDTWYWIGCVEGTTYVWTSKGGNAGANNGENNAWNWTAASRINKCYYDCGILIDDDDTMYVSYGSTQMWVAQLSKDGLSEVRSQQVYSPPGNTYIEGSHMYKRNGNYYIVPTKVASGEWVLKSSSPWGPYTMKVLADSLQGPISNAGYAHQGGLVDTPSGNWYYLAFMDAYPGGRIPVLAPITWGSDGFPAMVLVNGQWGKTYPMPIQTSKTMPGQTGVYRFTSAPLGEDWEWNHNPDKSRVRNTDDGLVLSAATVTNDLYTARNTLTRRILGPKSQGTFLIDVSKMADGDRAGATLFRDTAGWIGVQKTGGTATITMWNGLAMGSGWSTSNVGRVAATGPVLTQNTAYFRITCDVTPAFTGISATRQCTFSYSLNGSSYTTLGPSFGLSNQYTFFMGYRYGVFTHATKALGGSITVKQFEMQLV